MNLSAIILAAGKGTRMKSSLPKVMHKIASKPMIWHIMHMLHDACVEDSVVVVGPQSESLEDFLHYEFGETITAMQKERLGTGHAVQEGIKSLHNKDNNIVILYGDTPFIKEQTIQKMNELATDNVAVVALSFVAKDPGRYGRMMVGADGELERIVEFLDANEAERKVNLCNSGILLMNGMHKNLLDKIDNKNSKKEYYLTDIVQIAKENGLKVKHFSVDETEVLGINSRRDQALAEKVMQEKLRHKFLEEGVTLTDPEAVIFAVDTKIDHDCLIHPNVVFGPGAVLHSGVEIKSFSHIEGAEIKSGSVVGPFARLRPGTNLAEKTRVGNFVEIKNSDVGEGSKINHLSYIGDTKLGKNVNIGAGTITCNYDGYNKSETIIGEGVFIGSNTALIAPIEVGKDAIVAAGSTVTKNVADNSLVVTRGEEKSYAGKAVIIRERAKSKRNKINQDGKRL